MINMRHDQSVQITFDNGQSFLLWFMQDGTNSVAVEDESGKEIGRLGANVLIEFLYLKSLESKI